MATINAINSNIPIEISKGGTNATSLTNTDGVVYFDGTRLVTTAVGTATNVLTSNGAGVAPTFQAAASGGITTIAGDSGSATGATVTFNATSQAGSTINFSGSAATVSFNVTDANSNTIMGKTAGNSSIIANGGLQNVGFGDNTLHAVTSASNASAFGHNTLPILTSGISNSAFGSAALSHVVTGNNNCAFGVSTLSASTGSQNTAIGQNALGQLTAGDYNTALGWAAGFNYNNGTETYNICIGGETRGTAAETHTLRIGAGTGTGTGQLNQAFISGIQGISVTGTAVLVSSSDQLGVAASSRKFKENIVDMANEPLMSLRPVNFNYIGDEFKAKQWGLIAEEVMEVMPDLVVMKDNEPFTVKYLDLIPMLLNEVQKLRKEVEELKARV